jgi:hypothetical protein
VGVQTGGLREVYGRSSNKTSRLKTPINTGVSKGNGRSNGFFGLHFIYQDPVDPDFFCFGNTLLSIKFTKRHFGATPLYLLDIQTVVKLLF